MKNKILIPAVIASAVLVFGVAFVLNDESYKGAAFVYTPSDITKANPNIIVPAGSASLDSIDPRDLKTDITHTVIGTVKSVGTPIDWTDFMGDVHGSVPVTLDVIEVTKGNVTGNTITFYLDSFKKSDGTYLLLPHEAEFEVDEKVLVHLSSDPGFGHADDILYQVIGKYGKYQVINDKAYNDNRPIGGSLDSVKNESK